MKTILDEGKQWIQNQLEERWSPSGYIILDTPLLLWFPLGWITGRLTWRGPQIVERSLFVISRLRKIQVFFFPNLSIFALFQEASPVMFIPVAIGDFSVSESIKTPSLSDPVRFDPSQRPVYWNKSLNFGLSILMARLFCGLLVFNQWK